MFAKWVRANPGHVAVVVSGDDSNLGYEALKMQTMGLSTAAYLVAMRECKQVIEQAQCAQFPSVRLYSAEGELVDGKFEGSINKMSTETRPGEKKKKEKKNCNKNKRKKKR